MGLGDLARTDASLDEDALRQRLREAEAALESRNAELARVRIELADFRLRYRREVGQLHEELEELERAIAELELGEFAKRLEEEGGGIASGDTVGRPPSARALTSDSVRRLFRDVAKAIHPDRATAEDRERRHALMIEANRAYAMGDEDRLRTILQAWENSPEAVQGDDPGAARQRMARRLAQVERQLAAAAAELAELQDLPLCKLKTLVDEAAARGKDLIADQVRRLKRDVIAARNRLDAMRL